MSYRSGQTSSVETGIGRDSGAYRRGMVLGLTMAEIMLLLVFCLLIASAVIFKNERETRERLQERIAAAETVAFQANAESNVLREENARLLTLLSKRPSSSIASDEEWRKLVRSADLVATIEKAGISPERLAELAPEVNPLIKLVVSGRKGDDVASAVQRADEMQRQLAENPKLSAMETEELIRLATAAAAAEESGSGQHDWPPIINLSEAKGYSFAVGRAALSPEFVQLISTDIAEKVAQTVSTYRATVVEVIGHTDEQPLAPRPSNLDQRLVGVFDGATTVDSLLPGDNVGLGMARAVSVASILRADPRFEGVTVLPLSGGQMILPGDLVTDGTRTGDARERRRIEIRVRRPDMPPVD